MKIIERVKTISIVSIIISILLGIVFIAFPDKCITYFSLAIGISMILLGAASIIGFIINKAGPFTLALGIVSLIAGIIVCIKYQSIISIIVIILGIYMLASGIFNFFTSIKIITASLTFGWLTLALSLATSALGILAITRSGAVTIAVVQLIGASMIVYAIMDIISFIQVKRLVKDVKQAVEESGDIETDAVVIEESDDIETDAVVIEESDD